MKLRFNFVLIYSFVTLSLSHARGDLVPYECSSFHHAKMTVSCDFAGTDEIGRRLTKYNFLFQGMRSSFGGGFEGDSFRVSYDLFWNSTDRRHEVHAKLCYGTLPNHSRSSIPRHESVLTLCKWFTSKEMKLKVIPEGRNSGAPVELTLPPCLFPGQVLIEEMEVNPSIN